MNKENYFGMYIGQKVTHEKRKDYIGYLSEVMGIHYRMRDKEDTRSGVFLLSFAYLILRPFESLTEEEWNIVVSFFDKQVWKKQGSGQVVSMPMTFKYNPELLEYLISIGIDVFNLKEKGYAVYKDNLK